MSTQRREYPEISGFEHIYLEDSYVLGIVEHDDHIAFDIEAVLTEQHSMYHPPHEGEQYCYRRARIEFSGLRTCSWKEKRLERSTDATGEVDYGNIDLFYREGDRYLLSGDWGAVAIESDEPKLVLAA